MMLDEFLSDAALAVVIALMLVALTYWLYLTATLRANRRVATELDGLAKTVLDRLDAERGSADADPMRIRYRLSRDKAMAGGSCTFDAFTCADWYRASVHKTIRAAIEAEHPGWEIVGYHLLPDNGEEVTL